MNKNEKKTTIFRDVQYFKSKAKQNNNNKQQVYPKNRKPNSKTAWSRARSSLDMEKSIPKQRVLPSLEVTFISPQDLTSQVKPVVLGMPIPTPKLPRLRHVVVNWHNSLGISTPSLLRVVSSIIPSMARVLT